MLGTNEIEEIREKINNLNENEFKDLKDQAIIEFGKCPYPLHDYVSNEVWVLACDMVAKEEEIKWNI
jgi:hypothetical protein